MALSIINYFQWDIPEARIPFLIADAIIIVSLHYVERGIKAEKELEELKAEKEHTEHIVTKDSKRLQKAAIRDGQKRNMKHQKHNYSKNNKTSKNNIQIQQPSKNGKKA